MKQQLEQLLKDAEEVTAKMREALAKMQHPKTYAEIAEVVNGTWHVTPWGGITQYTTTSRYQLPTASAAKQDAAFRQIKVLEAYCKEKFEGEATETIMVNDSGDLFAIQFIYAPFYFTQKASDWLISTFPEIFKTFYNVTP